MQRVRDRLEHYAAQESTGRLRVFKGHISGYVYCQSGQLVHAEFYQLTGLDALRAILDWQECECAWENTASPQRKTLDHSFEGAMNALESPEEAETEPADDESDLQEEVKMQDNLTLNSFASKGVSTIDIKKIRLKLKCLTRADHVSDIDLPLTQNGSLILGNSSVCDIQILDDSILPEHCSLMLEDDILIIWDLGSAGKMALNEVIVDEGIIVQGDRLTLGDLDYEVEFYLRRSGFSDHSAVKSKPKRAVPSTGTLPDKPITFKESDTEDKESGLISRVFGKTKKKGS